MKTYRVFLIVAALAGWPAGSLAQPTNSWRLEAGPLTLEIHVSTTAHLFHVVDQVSGWSHLCHRQYQRYFAGLDGGLTLADWDRFAQHAALRKTHPWGRGLEQTFYTAVDLESALAQGMKAGWLTEAEVEIERRVLNYFQPRIERLLSEQRSTLVAFAEQLSGQRTNLAAMATNLSQFVGSTQLTVPVYLIANPDNAQIIGGFNGGRLTLEVPGGRNAYPSLLRELFHAFLRTRQSEIKRAAASVPGLNTETLIQGLVCALNPGSEADDGLLLTVTGYLAQGFTPRESSYTLFNLYGLALRPLLKDALADSRQNLETFLPRAADAWLVLTELEKVRVTKPAFKWEAWQYRDGPRNSLFIFGRHDQVDGQALAASAQLHYFGRPHDATEYKTILTEIAKPGDCIVLLLALDDEEGRVPKEYSHLLPLPWAEVEARLKQGKTVFRQGKSGHLREMTVFVLATPTRAGLRGEFRRLVADNLLRQMATITNPQP